MHRVAVQSTNIATIAHDPKTSVLEIEFRNGSTYRYFLVPECTFQALHRAPSKGTFFNAFIRPRYAFAKI